MIFRFWWFFSLLLLLFTDGAGSAENRSIVVDQIEILGVRELRADEVEAALFVSVGDPIDRAQIVKTVNSIEEVYRSEGYQKVSVRTVLIRRKDQGRLLNVVRISVNEGRPTRIGKIEISLTGSAFRSDDDRRDLEEETRRDSEISPGNLLDQGRLIENFRELQSSLESEDFVGVKLVRIEQSATTTPDSFLGTEEAKTTDEWIKVRYVIDVGDRVSFGFRGNTVFNRTDLLEVVDEQRSVGLGDNFVEQIRIKIQKMYQSKGFTDVRITHRTFERLQDRERHLTYYIDENERFTLGAIEFDGNETFRTDELKEKFFEFAPTLTERGYYVQEEIESGADLLVDWMKSRGYLSAKRITINRTLNAEYHRFNLLIFIYEGEQTRVRTINLHGVKSIPQDDVKKILSIREGEPLNLFAFNEGIEDLKAHYRSIGFLNARVTNEATNEVVKYQQRNRIADVTLSVSEGVRFRVGSIVIEGLKKTNIEIAKRELTFVEGDVLGQDQIRGSESRLRRLGLFGSVRVQHRDTPGRPGFKDVRILLSEGTPGVVAGGVGFRNDLGLRVFGNAGYSNIWHRNHGLDLTGSVNRRFIDFCQKRGRTVEDVCFVEYLFRLGYTWPWFLMEEMRFRPSISQEKRRFRDFDALTRALTVSFDKPIMDRLRLTAGLAYKLELTEQFNALGEVDNQSLIIGSITPSLSMDLRDNPLSPTKGFFTRVSFEYAAPAFLSQTVPFAIGYTKAQFRADYTVPMGSLSLYLSFRTGFSRNLVDPGDYPASVQPRVGIPLIKQFTLGGAASIRGFREQEINFTETAIRGTLAYVNYRTQIDMPLTGDMRFGPFLDAGNLLVDQYSLSEEMRFGAGIGFRYRTPVGPVNLDWGFKLFREAGEDPHRFYFTVGIL